MSKYRSTLDAQDTDTSSYLSFYPFHVVKSYYMGGRIQSLYETVRVHMPASNLEWI